jgi:lactoylglutathione lyase
MQLRYAIKYVADMDEAVAFHRDALGLILKFASPFWTEFSTGETTLALHAASDDHPAGSVQLGFGVDDLAGFYAAREEKGITFTAPPEQRFGATIARFRDSEGAENSISG